MMTTYELMRRLMQIDPTGQHPVMLSIKTTNGARDVEVTGFIDEIWTERPDEVSQPFVVLYGIDN